MKVEIDFTKASPDDIRKMIRMLQAYLGDQGYQQTHSTSYSANQYQPQMQQSSVPQGNPGYQGQQMQQQPGVQVYGDDVRKQADPVPFSFNIADLNKSIEQQQQKEKRDNDLGVRIV